MTPKTISDFIENPAMDIKTISDCAKEPIHIPGNIQYYGCLLGVQAQSGQIVYASDNLQAFFDTTALDALGSLFSEFVKTQLPGLLQPDEDPHNLLSETARYSASSATGTLLHVNIHTTDGLAIVEMEAFAGEEYDFYGDALTGQILQDFYETGNYDIVLNRSCQHILKLIDYDRVMIYRFADDGHGEVIAEAVKEGVASFLGLHFPASDIPQQARALYLKKTTRIFSDVDAPVSPIVALNADFAKQPLDLTYSELRAMSPIHAQYLRNMGVTSSFSVSIVIDNQLWGMILAHSLHQKHIDFSARNKCDKIGRFLAGNLNTLTTARDESENRLMSRNIASLLSKLEYDNMLSLVTTPGTSLVDITHADGALIKFGGKEYSIGTVPPPDFVKLLLGWSNHVKEDLFKHNNLSSVLGEDVVIPESATGIMFARLANKTGDIIFWFKKSKSMKLRWDRKPDDFPATDYEGKLIRIPDRKIEFWEQKTNSLSEEWSLSEVQNARLLRIRMVRMIAEQTFNLRQQHDELKEAFQDLNNFSLNLSHDLRSSLTSIKSYTQFLMRTSQGGHITDAGFLPRILDASNKMEVLIKDVLDYSRMQKREIEKSLVSVQDLLIDIITEMKVVYANCNPVIHTGPLPDLTGDKNLIYRVFLNLIQNAIKYSQVKGQPQVEISGTAGPQFITYTIKDNGIGISLTGSDQVFNLFTRLDNVGKEDGSGIGLATVKNIMDKHQARIWFESKLNEGTVFFLEFPR